MATAFDIIAEEFVDDLSAIRALVVASGDPQKPPKARVAAANSATLLVAATFEEFIREMAREYARTVVASAAAFEKLPTKLAATAWRRTMEGIAKMRFDGQYASSAENIFGNAQARFSVIYEFCRGDLSQDIYRDLIHNENNMRPGEVNALFKVGGLSDVVFKLSDKQLILDLVGETEVGKAHGKLISGLEGFFDRRNAIAHALNSSQSSGPEQIVQDINLLECLGCALRETLNAIAPAPVI